MQEVRWVRRILSSAQAKRSGSDRRQTPELPSLANAAHPFQSDFDPDQIGGRPGFERAFLFFFLHKD
jgi:hypothetical protein